MNIPNNDNSSIHKLNSKWVLWYHDPENSNWDFKSYEKICVFDSIELFWSIHNYIKNDLIYSGMFFIMKENINPLWEDNNNINGGCWSFKILKKNSYNAWLNLSVSLIGETLSNKFNLVMHEIYHLLGICGEKHLSFISFLVEWPNFHHIFNYIKILFKS